MGVTGARTEVNSDLPRLVARIRQHTTVPLAVGFGVSTRDHFVGVGQQSEGVVIGSKIITTLKTAAAAVVTAGTSIDSTATTESCAAAVEAFAAMITGKGEPPSSSNNSTVFSSSNTATTAATITAPPSKKLHSIPDRFGQFGGQYAPEALVDCLDEIESAFAAVLHDQSFWDEFKSYYSFMGRPSVREDGEE